MYDEEERVRALLRELVGLTEEISSISDYRNAYRKQLCNLSRRLKLLAPMFEELREDGVPVGDCGAVGALAWLRDALGSARDLLRLGSDGSKIFLVLESDKMMKQFQVVAVQLEQALGSIFLENFDISDEVREQVELVHSQFRRAKERVDTRDAELYSDLISIYNKNNDANPDPALLRRLAEKLQLVSISDLKQESLALQEMVVASGGRDPGEKIEKMSMLLKKIKDYLQTQNPEIGSPANSKDHVSCSKLQIPVVPEDFRCPISLEMMKDPVIVATGQG